MNEISPLSNFKFVTEHTVFELAKCCYKEQLRQPTPYVKTAFLRYGFGSRPSA